ncbi:MAG: MarR family winged helix-turn-helix transcriptional regulator [Bacteroidales bacterium]
MAYRFTDSPGKLLQDLSRSFGRYLHAEMKDQGFNINIHEWSTLSYLSSNQQASQKEIAGFLGVEKVYAKRLLDRLERKGLLTRRQDSADRRYNIIELTNNGREMFKNLKPLAERTIHQARKHISEEAYSSFLQTIRKMQDNLEK